jgi:hypothetical protein
LNCKETEELLSPYIDGELNREEIIKVEKHILECKKCGELLKDFKLIKNKIKSIEIPQVSLRVERKILGYNRIRNYFLRLIFSTSLLTGLGALLILTLGNQPSTVEEKPKEYYIVKEERTPYMEILYETDGDYILTNYEGGSL